MAPPPNIYIFIYVYMQNHCQGRNSCYPLLTDEETEVQSSSQLTGSRSPLQMLSFMSIEGRSQRGMVGAVGHVYIGRSPAQLEMGVLLIRSQQL